MHIYRHLRWRLVLCTRLLRRKSPVWVASQDSTLQGTSPHLKTSKISSPARSMGTLSMSYPVDQSPWPASPQPAVDVSMQAFQHPQILPHFNTDAIFDEPLLDFDWNPQPHDDMWEMRLGDADVEEISRYPFDPPQQTLLHVPPIGGFGQQMSPAVVPFNAFNSSFQSTLAMSVSDFPVSTSAIASPPLHTAYPVDFGASPHHNHSHRNDPPMSVSSTEGHNSREVSRDLSPTGSDAFAVTLPSMPLSPLNSPRLVEAGSVLR